MIDKWRCGSLALSHRARSPLFSRLLLIRDHAVRRPSWRLAIQRGRSEKDKASGPNGNGLAESSPPASHKPFARLGFRRPVLPMIGHIPAYLKSAAAVTDWAEDATL